MLVCDQLCPTAPSCRNDTYRGKSLIQSWCHDQGQYCGHFNALHSLWYVSFHITHCRCFIHLCTRSVYCSLLRLHYKIHVRTNVSVSKPRLIWIRRRGLAGRADKVLLMVSAINTLAITAFAVTAIARFVLLIDVSLLNSGGASSHTRSAPSTQSRALRVLGDVESWSSTVPVWCLSLFSSHIVDAGYFFNSRLSLQMLL